MSAQWSKAAKLQVGKEKWLDGELVVLKDRISFSGEQNVHIIMANITGSFELPTRPRWPLQAHGVHQRGLCATSYDEHRV